MIRKAAWVGHQRLKPGTASLAVLAWRPVTGWAGHVSVEAIRWALRDAPDVPPQCVSVLVALAEHADKHGCGAYPSTKTLAAYARKSERQANYDVRQLVKLGLIRPGDQSQASRLPVNRRPVVYDLAVERRRPSSGVQSTSPPEVQSTSSQDVSGVQPVAPQDDLQATAPQNHDDLGKQSGVQSTAPQDNGDLGCNTAQPGVQPTADKPSLNLSMADVGEGGFGGESKPARRRSQRDLNAGRGDVERVCVHLADRIEGNGNLRPRITKGWRDAARLLMDTDGRTEDQVHRAIDWCQSNEFWRKNVMSMPTLRKQYDRLRMEADDERKRDQQRRDLNGGRPRGGAADDLSGEVYGKGQTRI